MNYTININNKTQVNLFLGDDSILNQDFINTISQCATFAAVNMSLGKKFTLTLPPKLDDFESDNWYNQTSCFFYGITTSKTNSLSKNISETMPDQSYTKSELSESESNHISISDNAISVSSSLSDSVSYKKSVDDNSNESNLFIMILGILAIIGVATAAYHCCLNKYSNKVENPNSDNDIPLLTVAGGAPTIPNPINAHIPNDPFNLNIDHSLQ